MVDLDIDGRTDPGRVMNMVLPVYRVNVCVDDAEGENMISEKTTLLIRHRHYTVEIVLTDRGPEITKTFDRSKFHHPGTDKTSHLTSECEQRGCNG